MKTKVIIVLLLAFLSVPDTDAQKQAKTFITGIVLDEQEMPVSGASIFIDEVETKVLTNKRGEFKVRIKPGDVRVLAVKADVGITEQFIGEKVEFRLVLDKAKILKLTATRPEDEMVDIGYGSIKRKFLVNPVNKIDGTNPKFASYTSIYEMIKGEVPGVQVSGTSITIRGTGSIMLSTQPLFVVDGIATDQISNISPSEVKSIEVLKGAAASIYGSRGGNGVILINRHNGKK
jgi:TonB-dependent starch-binding outer membrane protein SusC